MNTFNRSLETILRQLNRAPVMGYFHPLLLLCLPNGVEVVSNASQLAEELDDLRPHTERLVLVNYFDASYQDRFLTSHLTDLPPAEIINKSLPLRLDNARRHLLTHTQVAQRIFDDTLEQGYQTIALLLVDGLSYDDVKDWPEKPEPCFINGPSVTFMKLEEGALDSEIGFPAIIGSPPLARRLVDAGIPHSQGFSYWEREQNDVTMAMFRGIPLTRVVGVTEALKRLTGISLNGTYLQILREGLDGLAHHRREVTNMEIQATVQAIRDDYRRLFELLMNSGLRGAVYLIADHGILWKHQHEDCFRKHESTHSRHPRYAVGVFEEDERLTQIKTKQQTYHLSHYPYLLASIRANESGSHGGLSYWESIVPFVRVEVNI